MFPTAVRALLVRSVCFLVLVLSSCATHRISQADYPHDLPWCTRLHAPTDLQDFDRFPKALDDTPMRSEVAPLVEPGVPTIAILHVGLDPQGRFACVVVERSSGDRELDWAAARGASRMTFSPALKDGRAVDAWTHLAVRGYVGSDEQACRAGLAWACYAATEEGIRTKRWDDARAAAETGCALHDQTNCGELGRLLTRDQDGDHDNARGRALLEHACAQKQYGSCRALGRLVELGIGGPADVVRARELYEEACSDGLDATGCNNAGVIYARGLGVPMDDARAVAFYEEACARGEESGCESAGQRYVTARGVPRDRAKGLRLLDHACKRGDATACGMLGEELAATDGVAAGMVLLRKACELGDLNVCERLLWKKAHGEDVGALPKAPPEIIAALDPLCHGGGGDACASMREIYRCGWGVARDAERERAYAARACDLRPMWDCVDAGKLASERGEPEKARELFLRGCAQGSGKGCALAASEEPDAAKARALQEQACAHGVCDGLEVLLLETDPARAQKIAEAECDSGGEDSCANLAHLVARSDDTGMTAVRVSGLLRRSCEGRRASACRELAARYRTGTGVVPRASTADELEQRAANLDADKDGCGTPISSDATR